jgi:hypothetical protein
MLRRVYGLKQVLKFSLLCRWRLRDVAGRPISAVAQNPEGFIERAKSPLRDLSRPILLTTNAEPERGTGEACTDEVPGLLPNENPFDGSAGPIEQPHSPA